MSTKDYEVIAELVGRTLFTVCEEDYEKVYDTLYKPLVKYMEQENPRFNRTAFSYAAAIAGAK